MHLIAIYVNGIKIYDAMIKNWRVSNEAKDIEPIDEAHTYRISLQAG